MICDLRLTIGESDIPLSPEHHLTPALSPISWRRGRAFGTRRVFDQPGLNPAVGWWAIGNRQS